MELPVKDGGLQTGPPKTKAGERTVTMPSSVLPMMTDHPSNFVAPDPAAHLYTGSTGQPLRPKALRNAFNKVKETLGLEGLHFHDLRHFAATEAGNAGASLRDLNGSRGMVKRENGTSISPHHERIATGRLRRVWHR